MATILVINVSLPYLPYPVSNSNHGSRGESINSKIKQNSATRRYSGLPSKPSARS